MSFWPDVFHIRRININRLDHITKLQDCNIWLGSMYIVVESGMSLVSLAPSFSFPRRMHTYHGLILLFLVYTYGLEIYKKYRLHCHNTKRESLVCLFMVWAWIKSTSTHPCRAIFSHKPLSVSTWLKFMPQRSYNRNSIKLHYHFFSPPKACLPRLEKQEKKYL